MRKRCLEKSASVTRSPYRKCGYIASLALSSLSCADPCFLYPFQVLYSGEENKQVEAAGTRPNNSMRLRTETPEHVNKYPWLETNMS